jgi:hypothetical protein
MLPDWQHLLDHEINVLYRVIYSLVQEDQP